MHYARHFNGEALVAPIDKGVFRRLKKEILHGVVGMASNMSERPRSWHTSME